jgi:hypothetical protein
MQMMCAVLLSLRRSAFAASGVYIKCEDIGNDILKGVVLCGRMCELSANVV